MANEVFISYRRKDTEFIHRLDAAFRAEGIDPWVDWEDIPKGAEWWTEIQRGIEGADIFVFSISPDSIASDSVCHWEIDHAKLHNKRIVPIIYRDLDSREDAPYPISVLDWLPFRESDDFEAGFQMLLAETHRHMDWIKPHTRLTVRAVEWELSDYNQSFLLTGADLKDAKKRSQQKDPELALSDLQISYIAASHQAAVRRQRTITGATAFALAVAALLCLVALFFFQDAERKAYAQQLANDKATLQAQARSTSEADQATAQLEAQQAIDRANTAQTAAAQAVTAEAEAIQAQATAQAVRAAAESNREAAQIAEQTAEAFRVLAEEQRTKAEQGQVEAASAQQTAQAAEQQAVQSQQTAQANQATAEVLRATAIASEATAQANQANALAQQREAQAAAAEAERARAAAEAAARQAEREQAEAERARAIAEANQKNAEATAVAVQTVQAEAEAQIRLANTLLQIKECVYLNEGEAIVYDDQNNLVWVLNTVSTISQFEENTSLFKLSADDCASESVTVPGGTISHRQAIAYGGNALWISSDQIGTVQKRDINGNLLGEAYLNGVTPIRGFFLYAADKLYMSRTDNQSLYGAIYEVDPNLVLPSRQITNGLPLGYPIFPDTREFDLAYDGRYIWVTNNSTFTLVDPTAPLGAAIVKAPARLPNDGSGSGALSVIFAANHIWIAGNDKIYKFQPQDATASVVNEFTIPDANLFGLAYDGTNLWASTYEDGDFFEIDPSTGAILTTLNTIYNDSHRIIFAQNSLWALPWKSQGTTPLRPVLKIPVGNLDQ
ncbi:MAG: toll/interleukin-1 receptor domain-containing protein [Chloroflexota bacterium]